MSKYDVFGIGNALLDIQAFVDYDFIKNTGFDKGVMTLIDDEKGKKILEMLKDHKISKVPGGACSNTISAVGKLGGKGIFYGVVSNDEYGKTYIEKIAKNGVKSIVKTHPYGISGSSNILTTPDAERTMLTNLGISREYAIEDIDENLFLSSKIFHITGYKWDTDLQKKVIEHFLEKAKKNGMVVSFDIADPFCINRNKDDFKRIIPQYVDILFANKEEATVLSGSSDPVEAGKIIRKMGPKIVLVKVGAEGAYLFYDNAFEKIEPYKAPKVLDSTGCGDSFAGGFLYGYTKGYTHTQSAKIANLIASQMVSVAGVDYEKIDFEGYILPFIKDNILK